MKNKETNIALKTLAIKARVYNQIRIGLFNKVLEATPLSRFKKMEVLTDEKKLELFNKWFELNKEAHIELNNYKKKRQKRAEIQALREKKKEHA